MHPTDNQNAKVLSKTKTKSTAKSRVNYNHEKNFQNLRPAGFEGWKSTKIVWKVERIWRSEKRNIFLVFIWSLYSFTDHTFHFYSLSIYFPLPRTQSAFLIRTAISFANKFPKMKQDTERCNAAFGFLDDFQFLTALTRLFADSSSSRDYFHV